MKNYLGIFVLAAVVMGCSSLTSKEPATNTTANTVTLPAKSEPAKTEPAKTDANGLTLEKFDQLKPGMKYEEAVTLLGSDGTETSSSSSSNNKYATYKWEGANNARITASFKNGELTSKNQSNVKSTGGSVSTADLSLAKYEQLKTGITYAEAVRIIGSEGSQTSGTNSGRYKSATYKWEGDKYARIYLIFK
ncbi:MAG: hypothetical protein AB7J13_13560, partial [Pyrinomonadaceae bacterium]